MRLLLVLVGLFLEFLSLGSANQSNSFRFGVGLTTIPPRFSSCYHVIESWLRQETPPSLIVLFLPHTYQNFIGESRRDKTKNIKTITNEIQSHFPEEYSAGRIVIQVVEKDYGPITKYLGLFEHHHKFQNIDYWLIGDDDVRYSPNTISDYGNYLESHPSPQILTHFKVHPRIAVSINGLSTNIPHLQGVDTILFPSSLLSSSRLYHFPVVSALVDYLHSTCPLSFYQDDYVISFLISLDKTHQVQSIWSGSKVAHHVNGVSRAGQQMHIHPQVFEREEATKHCLVSHAQQIYDLFQSSRKDYDL